MTEDLKPIRGTRDIMGTEVLLHEAVLAAAKKLAALYCYDALITPIFESSEVFHRTLGEESDVVSKETYTFFDRDRTSITLRPEFTAAVTRAVISNGLTQELPLKFFSYGPVFRHERPQKCRYRQFNQINFEFFGHDNAKSDVEIICLAMNLLKNLKIDHLIELEINTVGDLESRQKYSTALIEYLAAYKNHLSEDSLRRLKTNPLRILDSKDDGDKKIMDGAPSILDFLTKDAADYYEELTDMLKILNIQYIHNKNLVRGLDYYTHTVFEFTTAKLGSQGTVLAGGRYNGLVELMGGPKVCAIGFAAGVERLVSLCSQEEQTIARSERVHLIPIGQKAEEKSMILAENLRNAGISIYIDYRNSNLKKKMQIANKKSADVVVIFGEDELFNHTYQVKNMTTGAQEMIPASSLLEYLSNYLIKI